MLKTKDVTLLLVSFIFLFGRVGAQRQVQDSLLLEKAFKNKDKNIMDEVLNRWSQTDLANADTVVGDTTRLVNDIFESFVGKFLQKKMAGYYSFKDHNANGGQPSITTGLCRFTLQSAPFLFLQDTLQYANSPLDITDSDFMNYVKWLTDDNEQMPATVTNKDKLFAISMVLAKTNYKSIAYFPQKRFWNQLGAAYGYRPILYADGTMRQRVLVQFLGYIAKGAGFLFSYTAVNKQSIAYKERESRAIFLNSVLKFGQQLIGLVAGNYSLKLNRMILFKNKTRALIGYRVGACFYTALFDLSRLNDPNYTPLSVFNGIE
jgi:hypothetical protein